MRLPILRKTTLAVVFVTSGCVAQTEGLAPLKLKSIGEVSSLMYLPPDNAPELLLQLKDPQQSEQIAELLRRMAKEKIIPWATSALIDSLNDPNSTVRMRCSGALVREYQRNNNWAKIDELLVHPNPNVRAGATFELGEMAQERIDISPTEKTLMRALSDPVIGRYEIAVDGQLAAIALAVHFTAKNQTDKLRSVLLGKPQYTLISMIESLNYAAKTNKKFDLYPVIPILYEFLAVTQESVKLSITKAIVFGYIKNGQIKKAQELLTYSNNGQPDYLVQRITSEQLEPLGLTQKNQ